VLAADDGHVQRRLYRRTAFAASPGGAKWNLFNHPRLGMSNWLIEISSNLLIDQNIVIIPRPISQVEKWRNRLGFKYIINMPGPYVHVYMTH